MRTSVFATLLALAATSASCSLSSEDTFTQGAKKDPCDNAIPVCSYTAGCRMIEGENYIEGTFPGYRSFIVPTSGEASIAVIFYFRSQEAPGSDTEIVWYEPGCRDSVNHYLEGIDLFRQVGSDRQWTVVGAVYQEGDHLVEIRSDAAAEFMVKIEVSPLD